MSQPDTFKFDIRITERMMRNGRLSQTELAKFLESLVDCESNVESISLEQPGLARRADAVIAREAAPTPALVAVVREHSEESLR